MLTPELLAEVLTPVLTLRAMDGLDTAARRSSARQRALLALNGAAVAALLLSAAMYASDRVALASAVQAKARQCSLVSSYASSLQTSLAVLDAKVRAWLARSGHGLFVQLSRGELYKTPWKRQHHGSVHEDGSGSGHEIRASTSAGSGQSPAGIASLGPGRHGKTRAKGVLELSDEALRHWEQGAQDRRRVAHAATAKIEKVPGREEAPAEGIALTDYTQQHPILVLPREAPSPGALGFVSAPVSSMIEGYGPPTAGQAGTQERTCDEDFGNALVARWRAAGREWCAPVGAPKRAQALGGSESKSESGGGNEAGGSRITCYFVRQSEHGGDGDNLCVMENVAVNLGVFGDEAITGKVMRDCKMLVYVCRAFSRLLYCECVCARVRACMRACVRVWKRERECMQAGFYHVCSRVCTYIHVYIH